MRVTAGGQPVRAGVEQTPKGVFSFIAKLFHIHVSLRRPDAALGAVRHLLKRATIEVLKVGSMKASRFAWWVWLCLATAFGVLGIFCLGYQENLTDRSHRVFFFISSIGLLVIGAIIAIVGFIRFIKWAWND
jgi:hypothetical protein